MEDYETAEECKRRIRERTNRILLKEEKPNVGNFFEVLSDYIDIYLKYSH